MAAPRVEEARKRIINLHSAQPRGKLFIHCPGVILLLNIQTHFGQLAASSYQDHQDLFLFLLVAET